MKSEQRHELAENDLAESVEHLAERMRPYLPTILIAAIGSLLAVFLSLFISAGWEASRAESWDACLGALASGDENAFREVILRYPDSPAAQWAELVLADRNLSEATDLLFAPLDPANDVARQRLEDAAASYAGILSQRPTGMVAERATLGLAKARESLGELDEARRGYEALAQEYGESPMAKLAVAHAADLARGDTKAFYNWFAEAPTQRPQRTRQPRLKKSLRLPTERLVRTLRQLRSQRQRKPRRKPQRSDPWTLHRLIHRRNRVLRLSSLWMKRWPGGGSIRFSASNSVSSAGHTSPGRLKKGLSGSMA
ncbi:MAG: hypothetical protein EBZ13_03235 [Planctomycetia bacterium]|nr:hypothetical protein [Planctomycetia bacterium]